MKLFVLSVLFLVAAVSASDPADLFTTTGESTDDVMLCKRAVKCERIRINWDVLANKEMSIDHTPYKKSHVIEKQGQTMFGFQVSV
jgi:hypothetical protein